MTDTNQKKLGSTLWGIADQLRGAMDADDFRDYMLSFLFLRYLSDNYETAAKRELGNDYPALPAEDRRVPLALWYANNPETSRPLRSRCAARCIMSSSRRTSGTASPAWPAPRTRNS
jgi:HsdM N-terminal domain